MVVDKSLTPKPDDPDMPLVSRLLYQLIDEKYKTLLDESSDLMCITDRQGKFIYVNKKLADSLGFTKKEMLGMHMNDILCEESQREFAEKAKEFLKDGKTKISNFAIKTKFGGRIVGEMNSIAFYDNLGKCCGAKAVFKDQTKMRQIESLEKKYESCLEDGIDTLDSVIIILDKEYRVKWASSSVQKYFGLDKAAIISEDIRGILKDKMSLLIREDELFLENLFSAYEANTSVESFECEVTPLGGGENYYMEHWSYPIARGDLSGGRIEIFRDITVRKRSEETLEYYYKKIHAIMEHAVEGIIEVKMDNSIEFVNNSFLEKIGYSEMEMLNRHLADFILPEQRSRLASIKLIRKAREVTFVRKDGSWLYTLMSSIPLVFGTHPPYALMFISDITETKTASLKLRDANLTLRALNDSLLDVSLRDVRTGVYNYRYLNERLAEEIKRARRYFRSFSLILMDIDFFKTINDTYGHSYGDVILKDFTELLKRSVRETDVLVRAGGEEFVVFLSETDTLGAVNVARKIVRAVESTLLGNAERRVRLTISLGVASYPEMGIQDAPSLLEAADHAMYQSKSKGRNIITVFSQNKVEMQSPGLFDGKVPLYGNLKGRLKKINLRNEESILESLRPMVHEAFRRQGYADNIVERMLKGVEVLAGSFSLDEKNIQDAKRAVFLCNLGLLELPADVLLKQGVLSDAEKESIREHPMRSAQMVRDISFLAPLEKDILYHHERYDGRGYPVELQGEDIPIASRMIHVIEAYEALMTSRPYRTAVFSKNDALGIIEKESGKQFDPEVVSHFLKQAV